MLVHISTTNRIKSEDNSSQMASRICNRLTLHECRTRGSSDHENRNDIKQQKTYFHFALPLQKYCFQQCHWTGPSLVASVVTHKATVGICDFVSSGIAGRSDREGNWDSYDPPPPRKISVEALPEVLKNWREYRSENLRSV